MRFLYVRCLFHPYQCFVVLITAHPFELFATLQMHPFFFFAVPIRKRYFKVNVVFYYIKMVLRPCPFQNF